MFSLSIRWRICRMRWSRVLTSINPSRGEIALLAIQPWIRSPNFLMQASFCPISSSNPASLVLFSSVAMRHSVAAGPGSHGAFGPRLAPGAGSASYTAVIAPRSLISSRLNRSWIGVGVPLLLAAVHPATVKPPASVAAIHPAVSLPFRLLAEPAAGVRAQRRAGRHEADVLRFDPGRLQPAWRQPGVEGVRVAAVFRRRRACWRLRSAQRAVAVPARPGSELQRRCRVEPRRRLRVLRYRCVVFASSLEPDFHSEHSAELLHRVGARGRAPAKVPYRIGAAAGQHRYPAVLQWRLVDQRQQLFAEPVCSCCMHGDVRVLTRRPS